MRNIEEDAPISFDYEDRAEGLYDPNNEAEEFFRNATVIYPDGSTRKLPAPATEEVSLQLSQDVLEYYRSKGEDWQAAIDESFRRSMQT